LERRSKDSETLCCSASTKTIREQGGVAGIIPLIPGFQIIDQHTVRAGNSHSDKTPGNRILEMGK
jgi:hypothetical protein